MNTKSILITVLALAAGFSSARAQGTNLDFDGRKAGIPSVSIAKAAEASATAPAPSKPALSKPDPAQKGYYGEARQCQSFIYSNGGAYRQHVKFQTSFTEQICRDTYITSSDGTSTVISQCHDENHWYSAGIWLDIGERQLRAGETEEIKFCYDFQKWKGSVQVKASPIEYSYSTNQEDQGVLWVTLTPLRRKPVDPDKAVVELNSFTYNEASREFTLKIDEKILGLSSDYFGKNIVIGVELVQDKLFNSSKGTKHFEFPVTWLTSDFTMTFKESDFDADKDDGDMKGRDKKYFVNWGFRMKGEPFTDKFVEKGKTGTITVR